MINAKVGKGTECQVTSRGTPADVAEDVCNIANGIYTGFLLANNVLGAALFRTTLLMILNDRESPIWRLNKSAEGVAVRVPKRKTPPESGGPSA